VIKSDEYDILRFMRFFGPLKKEQVCMYFESKINGDVKRIISNMCARRILAYDVKRFLLYPSGRIDERQVDFKMIAAFWVFLRFKDVAVGVYPTQYPTQILFVKDDTEYEIAFIDKGEEVILSATLNEKNSGDVKYLIIVENLEQIPSINIKNVAAYCTRRAGKVEFYKPSESEVVCNE